MTDGAPKAPPSASCKTLSAIENMRSLIILSAILILLACNNKQELNYHTNIIDGLKESKNTGKPIFLLFNLYSIGYDSFKYKIISNKDVVQKLNKNFVNIILYCDDRRKMRKEDTLAFSEFGLDNMIRPYQSKIETFGNLNAYLEISMYDIRTQPLYLVLDSKMNLVIDRFGYVADPETFGSKLDVALRKLK